MVEGLYKVGTASLRVVGSFRYEYNPRDPFGNPKLDGVQCLQLASDDGRYGLVCSIDEFMTLECEVLS